MFSSASVKYNIFASFSASIGVKSESFNINKPFDLTKMFHRKWNLEISNVIIIIIPH